MGLPRMDLARKVISDLQLPISPDQYIRETVEIQETLFPGAELRPGAERLINHLAESGVPIALATSSPRDSYLVKTRNHQVVSFFYIIKDDDSIQFFIFLYYVEQKINLKIHLRLRNNYQSVIPNAYSGDISSKSGLLFICNTV